MEKEVQEFLEAEETAEKLVQTLKKLHTEATSYQAATKELDTVRQRLINLIESTENVVNGSHEVVEVLKKIGGPEILSRLTTLGEQSGQEFAGQSQTLSRLIKLGEELTQESTTHSKSLGRLHTLLIIAIVSSAVGAVLGIVSLIR